MSSVKIGLVTSHTLLKAATTFIAVLATFLDPQVSNSIEKINMQFRKIVVNLVKIGAVKPRHYYIKRSKQNFCPTFKNFRPIWMSRYRH